MGLAIVLVVMVGSLVQTLQASLQTTSVTLAKLTRVNVSLEAAVAHRTTELQEREALLRSITDALPDGYLFQVIQRRDGSYVGYTYLSGGVERLFGLAAATMSASNSLLHKVILPEDRARVAAVDQESIRSLTRFEVEARARKADGSIGWFQFRALPQLRSDGLVSWNGICQEITARKQAELALATSEEKYRTLFALLPTGVMLIDAQGRIVEVNAASERMLGLSAGEQSRRSILDEGWDVIQPDGTSFPPAAFPGVRALHQGQVIGDVEVGVARPDGRRTWLSVSAAPLAHAAAGTVIAFTDIHQGETACALRAREAQLRTIGDNLPSGFIYQLRRDADWRPRFTFLSSGVAQTLGVSVEEGLRDAGAIYAAHGRTDNLWCAPEGSDGALPLRRERAAGCGR